ncbi:MAG: threonine/serine exporter family protein [Lachnospiraceae bacterium]|nr:threonine/serine exporter family protein [Lachnospiraceae bacterium]
MGTGKARKNGKNTEKKYEKKYEKKIAQNTVTGQNGKAVNRGNRDHAVLDHNVLNDADLNHNVLDNKVPDNGAPSNEIDDIDVVLEAGEILIESGAEIYRVDETMQHFAKVLQIAEFESCIVNQGIMGSGRNRHGELVAKVAMVSETKVHLGKLEAVNDLSRSLKPEEHPPLEKIAEKLQEIDNKPEAKVQYTLLAFFLGAGGLSYAIGIPLLDAFLAALCGMVLGLFLRFINKHIHTRFLVTILGSAVVTLIAHLLHLQTFGGHAGLTILGTLMLMVPGAVFVNSVREFSQNNYTTGISLLMAALLTGISIAVGVAAVSEVLPFAEQITDSFNGRVDSVWEGILRVIAAGIGTIAFSYLYHAPRRYFKDLCLLAAASWTIYLCLVQFTGLVPVAVFAAATFVSLCSRRLSVVRKCPMTIFLSTSIFPLMPGLSLYRGIYYLLIGVNDLAYTYMRSCFVTAFTIAIAISLVQQLLGRKLVRRKILNKSIVM